MELKVKNTSSRKVDYDIRSRFDNGDRSFYEILEITLRSSERLIYAGKLSGMTGQLGTGSLQSGGEEKLDLTAYFPKEAGNEYQEKAVVTVLEFAAKAAPDEPSPGPSTAPSPGPSTTSEPTPTQGPSSTPDPTPSQEPSSTLDPTPTHGPSSSVPASTPTQRPLPTSGQNPEASTKPVPSSLPSLTPPSTNGIGLSAEPGIPSSSPLSSASGLASEEDQSAQVEVMDEALPKGDPATGKGSGQPESARPYTLPDTATPWYNLLVICTLTILGCAVLLWKKRN